MIEQKLKVISNDLLEMLSESGIGDTLVARHTISEHIGGLLSNINDSDEKLKSELTFRLYDLIDRLSQVDMDEPEFEQAEAPLPTEEVSKDEALVLAEQIRQSIQQRSPEFDSVTEEAEKENSPANEEAAVSEAEPVSADAEVKAPEESAVQEDKEEATV